MLLETNTSFFINIHNSTGQHLSFTWKEKSLNSLKKTFHSTIDQSVFCNLVGISSGPWLSENNVVQHSLLNSLLFVTYSSVVLAAKSIRSYLSLPALSPYKLYIVVVGRFFLLETLRSDAFVKETTGNVIDWFHFGCKGVAKIVLQEFLKAGRVVIDKCCKKYCIRHTVFSYERYWQFCY